MIKNPKAIANELETFKRQHNGGEIITDAVNALREMSDELDELREQSAMFKKVVRWVKKNVGIHICGIRFREKKRGAKSGIVLRMANPAERVEFDAMMSQCERMIPDSGVWRRV